MPDANTGFLTDEDTKKYISRVALALFAFEIASFVAAYALAFVLSGVLSGIYPDLLSSADFVAIANNLLNVLALYCIALPVFCVIVSPLPKIKPYKEKLDAKGFVGGLCVCIFAMTIGSSISQSIIISFQQITGRSLTNPVDEMVGQSSLWIDIVFVAVLVPILEELFFRKLLCNKLLPLGEGYAIILSSVIFGLSHGNLFQFCYAFFVGLVLSLIYVKTGRIIYGVIYHMFLNFTGGVLITLLTKNIDYDGLEILLYDIEQGSATTEQMLPFLQQMMPLLIYEMIIGIMGIIGLVLMLRAFKKKTIRVEEGILPPPKKHRVANVLCTVGSAALITAYAFFFVLSVVPSLQ